MRRRPSGTSRRAGSRGPSSTSACPTCTQVPVTGWDVADICRTFTPEMGLLFVSAQGGPEVQARADAMGRAAFLEKPIDSASLAATLGRLGLP